VLLNMPHKYKIIVSSNSAWNVYNFRKCIILKLINAGFEVVVVSPFDEYASKLCKFGCKYVNVSIDNSGVNIINDLYLIFQYLKIFFKIKPNAVLSYTAKPNIYGSIAASVYSIPVVNNVSGLGTAFIRGGVLGGVVSFLYKISLVKSKCVFFQNSDDRDLFLRKNLVTEGRVDILPGSGIDLKYYKVLNIDNGADFIFLLVSRLIWDKGVQEYVDAARLIRKNSPNIRFQILGFLDVDNKTAISKFNVDNWVQEGVVEYLGCADDVRPFMQKSNCIVLPSYREGMPKTLLEAAAMGKPIITTDVEGCRDVVDNKVNGYLCNARDAYDLAKKIEIMLKMDPKDIKKMGLKGRDKMEKEFDEKIVIDKYMSVVDKIIGQ
jgi:glycosyltransferase involved in cell wall biosynthesis